MASLLGKIDSAKNPKGDLLYVNEATGEFRTAEKGFFTRWRLKREGFTCKAEVVADKINAYITSNFASLTETKQKRDKLCQSLNTFQGRISKNNKNRTNLLNPSIDELDAIVFVTGSDPTDVPRAASPVLSANRSPRAPVSPTATTLPPSPLSARSENFEQQAGSPALAVSSRSSANFPPLQLGSPRLSMSPRGPDNSPVLEPTVVVEDFNTMLNLELANVSQKYDFRAPDLIQIKRKVLAAFQKGSNTNKDTICLKVEIEARNHATGKNQLVWKTHSRIIQEKYGSVISSSEVDRVARSTNSVHEFRDAIDQLAFENSQRKKDLFIQEQGVIISKALKELRGRFLTFPSDEREVQMVFKLDSSIREFIRTQFPATYQAIDYQDFTSSTGKLRQFLFSFFRFENRNLDDFYREISEFLRLEKRDELALRSWISERFSIRDLRFKSKALNFYHQHFDFRPRVRVHEDYFSSAITHAYTATPSFALLDLPSYLAKENLDSQLQEILNKPEFYPVKPGSYLLIREKLVDLLLSQINQTQEGLRKRVLDKAAEISANKNKALQDPETAEQETNAMIGAIIAGELQS